MDNNITIQNTISIGIEIPPETFINEKTINVQNLIIESSSTNNGTICIPDNVSNNIVVPSKKKKIFIVHGHDNEVKLEVARFIEKIGLEPIILHEQVNSGMTVIEKIEKYSDVEFGIVLYTPCDLGYVKGKKKEKKARARQNVVFEHGYLIGKLGRNNVCALVKGDIELPNDISGIVCNGVQREHNKKLNNGLPILHKVPPKRDYGRYFCIMAEKGGTSHGGLTEKLSPFFHAKKQEVNAYGR